MTIGYRHKTQSFRPWVRFVLACAVTLLGAPSLDSSLQGADSATEAKADFRSDVLPVLKSRCIRCHGPQTQEANVRLDNLSSDLFSNRAAAETWHEVLNVLGAGEMPPEGEPPLTREELNTVTSWIRQTIEETVAAQRASSGRTTLRRLNRIEYQNTMTDLLGVEMNYIRDLPPDPASPEGFQNDGSALGMSAMQLEVYLDAARRGLERAIVEGPPPEVHEHTFAESNVNNWLGNPHIASRLGRQQVFLAKMAKEYPETGEFLVQVTVSAELKPDKGFPLLEVSVGYRPDTKVLFREFGLVEVDSEGEQTFEFRGRIEDFPLPVRGQGKYPGLVVRVRNAYDDGSPLPGEVKGKKGKGKKKEYPEEPHLPTLTVNSVSFRGPVFEQWPPVAHRRILFDSPLREDESAYVAEVLERFLDRAFRRPATREETDNALAFFESIRPEYPTFEGAIRETLAMVLVQPQFLYLLEPAGEEKREVDDWELASRLSYFLWSSMPDEELFELAAKGDLKTREILTEQVQRMLTSPRAWNFIEQFTQQWFRLQQLDTVAVDPDYYPNFAESLKNEMRAETQHYFAELVRDNRSALELLESEYTIVNEPLAKHYGWEGIYGREFRRVTLPADERRAGVLGHASVLLANSTGADSHAVRRAVWIRDRLLNDPPAPPPPDVPPLDEADPDFHELSVREQLARHREREACASCHRDIDPWGIALEHYDAVGLYRDEVRRKRGKKFEMLAVVAEDTLPGGYRLAGATGLRDHIMTTHRRDFTRSVVVRLTSYALGRQLDLVDEEELDRLHEEFAKNDFRMRDLIQQIIASSLFRTK